MYSVHGNNPLLSYDSIMMQDTCSYLKKCFKSYILEVDFLVNQVIKVMIYKIPVEMNLHIHLKNNFTELTEEYNIMRER